MEGVEKNYKIILEDKLEKLYRHAGEEKTKFDFVNNSVNDLQS